MATYKVIQDIEAEDKLLGPLSLKQFIFGLIAALFFYLCFLVISKHVLFLLALFLPPALIAGFFAWPWTSDQPTEIWALAKLRFLFKPRQRIWDQSGVKELVTITVPKKIEERRTNGLSENEVTSRLNALADTIDSRGWAIKNVNINLTTQPDYLSSTDNSDRLVDVRNTAQAVEDNEVQAADDILDAQNNPIAQQFDQMINASSRAHRDELMNMMSQPNISLPEPVGQVSPSVNQQSASPPNNYWFLNQPVEPPKLSRNQSTFTAMPVVTPGMDDSGQGGIVHAATPTADEEAVGERLKTEHQKPTAAYSHLKTIQPLGNHPQAAQTTNTPQLASQNPAVAQFVDNNDLDVATIARQTHKNDTKTHTFPDDEVVVSLH